MVFYPVFVVDFCVIKQKNERVRFVFLTEKTFFRPKSL